MKEWFDYYVERRGTDSSKWNLEAMKNMGGYADEDSIPMWVADMDFKSPRIILEKLKERIDHGILGYSGPTAGYYESLIHWFSKRQGWNIEKDWVITTPGVVPALYYLIQALTEKGEGVIIQTPVYYSFKRAIVNTGRVVVENQLKEEKNKYTIDFEDLKKKAAQADTKLMILCSPHNPIGKVWTREELEQINDICKKNGVVLISDEIHSDLILFDTNFVSVGALCQEIDENTIICTAPSKTFNIAGLQTSNIVIKNKALREKMNEYLLTISGRTTPNLFGNVALQAAYSNEGEEWLDELKEYLEENYLLIIEFLKEKLPDIAWSPLEGTYLLWLDFRNLSSYTCAEELEKKVAEVAKLVLDGGSIFGECGQGFMRMNIACPRPVIQEALDRLYNTFK